LNEPEFHDRYRWQGVQGKLAGAIREGAPQHTIIVAGAYWSSESELLFFDPLRIRTLFTIFIFTNRTSSRIKVRPGARITYITERPAVPFDAGKCA